MSGKRDVTGTLVSSLILFAISIVSYYYFLETDYFVTPKKKWSTPAGYTKQQFVLLVVGTYLIPIAIIFMSLFISKSLQQIPDQGYFKLSVYIFLKFAFFAGCITSARVSWEVLGCIGSFCVGTSTPGTTSSGSISANMVFFFICLYFFLALSGATAITGLKKYRSHYLVPRPTYRHMNITNQTRSTNDKQNITSEALSVNSMNDLRAAESRHRKERKYSLVKEMIIVALVFAVLYPILFIACMILPTWWSGFTKFKIQQYHAHVPPQSHGIYWAMTVKEDVVLKLFPDILIYYGAIYFVSLLALVAQFWPPLKRFFHMRLTPTVCVGEALLAVALVLLVGGSWLYWFTIHIYENEPEKVRTSAELAARSFGQIGNVVMGLLVLPVAKNGVWSRVFGVSWEGMIVYHQILGYSFLLIILSHMFSWWTVYSQKGSFPSDILAVPMIYHKDNFTVPLGVVTAFFMFVIMGGFTFHIIRRKNYELFYYLHFFSGVIFLTALWHATMSWYYITAGLILYALDHAIRLLNTVATVVQVEEFSAAVKDASRTPSRTSTPSNSAHGFNQSPASPATANTSLLSGSATTSSTSDAALGVDITGVTKLSYTVKYHVKEGSRPMSHLMGQYVYINIPAISSLEWHPFTISSAPVDAVSTHHIKVMGGLHGNQWTAKLHLLALDLQHRERDIERTRERERERGVGLTSIDLHDTQARNQHPTQNQNLFQNQNPMLGQFQNHTQGSESKSGETEMDNLPLVSHQQQQSQQQSPRQLSLSTLQVNIDGPYGLSVVHELHKYSHILLIGGGIGVTPLHSCLRHLLLMKLCASNGSFEGTEGGRGSGSGTGTGSGRGGQEEPLSFPFPAMESVKLLWSVRSIEEASLFADTLSLVDSYPSNACEGERDMFSARVFVTTSIGMSTSNALLDSNRSSERSENDTSSRGHSTHERESESVSVNAIAPLHRPVERGRPDLKAEISRLTPHQHRALVFVCGPSSMVAEASALSMKSGVDFRHETFEL